MTQSRRPRCSAGGGNLDRGMMPPERESDPMHDNEPVPVKLDRERLHDVIALINGADRPTARMTRALLEAARNAHVKASIIDALAGYGAIIAQAEEAAEAAKEAKAVAKDQWLLVVQALHRGPDQFDADAPSHADH